MLCFCPRLCYNIARYFAKGMIYVTTPIRVRGISIGDGMPKIIAPIVGEAAGTILCEAAAIRDSGANIAEWRIDWYTDGTQAACVAALAGELRGALGDIPLLCTFRTQKEGGAKPIQPDVYARLLMDICTTKSVDMIDVEAFTGDALVKEIIACAHENGVCVVASNHDFHATPAQSEILRRLTYMAQMGADIAKIAVMPRNNHDVLALLGATVHAADTLSCPLITMAMGGAGVVTRLAGECFGSSCTFGSVGKASAPGQVPVAQLRDVLNLLHQ